MMAKRPHRVPLPIIVIGLLVLSGLFFFRYSSLLPLSAKQSDLTRINPLILNKQVSEGDILFQTSQSEQSKAIQLATHSVYSHCGIIFKEGKNYYVTEAVQPVKKTPLIQWINRGKNGKYVIKRLKNSEKILNENVLKKMKSESEKFLNKNYDLTFEWNDDKIYCSELVWKIYHRACGIELGKLQKWKDLDLNNPLVQKKMKERYGNKFPENEWVISPAAIYNSDLLETIPVPMK